MPNEKQNALEALDQARTLVGDGPALALSGVRLVQLRSFIEYARECVGAIEETKRPRRQKKVALGEIPESWGRVEEKTDERSDPDV